MKNARVYQFRHIPTEVISKMLYLLFAFFGALLFVLALLAFKLVAFALVAGTLTGAVAGDGVAVAVGAGVGSAAVDCRTEREPVSAGSESVSAVSIKRPAAMIVILASKVCVPRGPKAVLDTELVKSAPASALPGCNNTAITSTRHDKMNSPYNE